ncbi:MAG: LLM class flavin-dependent oxidoreductase [Streptosporangiales bacterium]|nr:LLM class flavin-dependent oxidoreductase [Streptosporangiales bacterium]
MPDYGHDLLFGAFLTPSARQPRQVVDLAAFCEQVGLDLVTFQDHPYQPSFVDTWTLLSYVAARTTTIRLAPNVLNLPLRPPAVVARSAASLDLLCGGRVELGLGAGAFWDAIEAMGGRRLSPGESLRGLAEAIEVIRGIWDADERGVLRVDGEQHRVHGAKRGPAPAHRIELWIGAYKPRALALTGRAGDGWLPSLGYIEPAGLAEGNAVIDDAATSAGRDPAEVRRLFNVNGRFAADGRGFLQGPPSRWVEELAELVLRDGVSAFVLGGDDPASLRRFAEEVAPELRELVAAERSGGGARAGASGAVVPPVPERTTPTEYARLGVTPTPAPEQRHSSRRLWDEDDRPARPAASADATYTEHGRAVGAHLVDVHDQLRAELSQVRDLVDQVRAGAKSVADARSELNEMTLRQNNWTLGAYCASYCRVVAGHHALEDDAIFPHLRSADRGLAPVIDRLVDEHKVIHDVLENVDRALVELVARPDDLSGLQDAVDVLTDTLLSHLSYEEYQLVEPLARLGFYPGQV